MLWNSKAGLAVLGFCAVAIAAAPAAAQRIDPRAETLARMMRPVTLDVQDARLEDLMRFITEFTGAQLDVAWTDLRMGEGLNRDEEISIAATNVPTLVLLERILAKADAGFDGATWQLSSDGLLEVGPRGRLNLRAYVRIYDVSDMLFEIPDFPEVPELNLNAVLRQGGGGGGGGGIFQQAQQQTDVGLTLAERTERLRMLLVELIEPEQWIDNGGDAASARSYEGRLIIRAPDYIHRQIDGYPFWPQAVSLSRAYGARYVTTGVQTQSAQEVDRKTVETTGDVGGP